MKKIIRLFWRAIAVTFSVLLVGIFYLSLIPVIIYSISYILIYYVSDTGIAKRQFKAASHQEFKKCNSKIPRRIQYSAWELKENPDEMLIRVYLHKQEKGREQYWNPTLWERVLGSLYVDRQNSIYSWSSNYLPLEFIWNKSTKTSQLYRVAGTIVYNQPGGGLLYQAKALEFCNDKI